ncbi:hypothetical protein KPH14_002512 [Odynerus spinipes]|uniref:Uncharacterized protein n=1 Tax=Odynerus spinipes TaxID=1348599 RepID=A0AAD9RTE9_9HYME|nr:hypothetical protein KPH14_002512 [Odynerus spinipes]
MNVNFGLGIIWNIGSHIDKLPLDDRSLARSKFEMSWADGAVSGSGHLDSNFARTPRKRPSRSSGSPDERHRHGWQCG